MPLVRLENVCKRFGAEDVLRGITFDIRSGEVVAVIGPSGSGKSTLVRCINHLEQIQGGRICVDGSEISPDGIRSQGRLLSGREIARYRAKVGMVFQSFNLFPHLTVIGNLVEAPIGVLGWPKSRAVERAAELLRRVGLSEKQKAYPAQLSGGQQQRVAIARALMMDPMVMLFDEPTSALDPELKGEVLDVIRDLALRDRTSVIVTHELRFAREVATHLVFIEGGQIVEAGPAGDILDCPRSARTRAFISRV